MAATTGASGGGGVELVGLFLGQENNRLLTDLRGGQNRAVIEAQKLALRLRDIDRTRPVDSKKKLKELADGKYKAPAKFTVVDALGSTTPSDKRAMLLGFGKAGDVVVGAAGQEVMSAATADPAEKPVYESAKKSVDQINGVLRVQEVYDQMHKSNKSETEVLAQLNISAAEFATMRDAAIATFDQPLLVDIFPELGGVSDATRQAIILQTMVRDPAMMVEITSRMQEISKKVAKLDRGAGKGVTTDRIGKEEKIAEELGSVLSGSLGTVLGEHMVKVDTLNAELVKQMETRKAAELPAALRRQMEKNWIEYKGETGEPEYHYDKIGRDIKWAIAHVPPLEKSDATKIMMLRDLQKQGVIPSQVIDIDGKAVFWENAKLELLPKEIQGTLDVAYNQMGAAYEQKMLDCFFEANRSEGAKVTELSVGGHLIHRFIKGETALTHEQWDRLAKKDGYMTEVDAAISNAAEHDANVARIMDNIKDADVRKKTSLKWLLFSLLGLGAALVLGPVSHLAAAAAAVVIPGVGIARETKISSMPNP